MGKIIITIEVPEGVTPSVDYAQNAPQQAPQGEPAPWSGWEQNAGPGPSGAPTGKPTCPQHGDQRIKTGKRGIYCATPIEKDENDNVIKWCQWKP